MRVVFIGRDNIFNRNFIKEVFLEEHEIKGLFFVEPDRTTIKAKLKKIFKRIKKYGILRVLDELAFHFYDRNFLRKKEIGYLKQSHFFTEKVELNFPTYYVNEINDKRWIDKIKEYSPDIIFSICTHLIFSKELYNIPKLGAFVLHEGIVPEYRGLHCILWALMKKDYQDIGYSVIKINNKIDGGQVLVQGKYLLNSNENYRTWSYISHNALIKGIAEIKKAFSDLEKTNKFEPVNINNRIDNYYTWMRLSEFYRLYKKNYSI